jgi:hypothetical protein
LMIFVDIDAEVGSCLLCFSFFLGKSGLDAHSLLPRSFASFLHSGVFRSFVVAFWEF